jgi:DNA-binding transcriptional regulator YiaG
MTVEEYKAAREKLGLKVLEWCDELAISLDTHKSYNSGRQPVGPTVAKLIKALLKIKQLEGRL